MGHIRYTFDASTRAVFELMTNADFLTRRCEALGEINVKVAVDRHPDTDTVEIRINRDVKRNLPSFARRIFKAVNHVEEIQTWKVTGDTMSCTTQIDVIGTKAVKICEHWELTPDSGRCTLSHQVMVTASYPLIGKRIEKFVIGQTESSIREQVEFAKRELG